jgi:hypothetical protein
MNVMKKLNILKKSAVATSVLSLASLGIVTPAIAGNATSPNSTTASRVVAATPNEQEIQLAQQQQHSPGLECRQVDVHTYARTRPNLNIRYGPVLPPGQEVAGVPVSGPWLRLQSPHPGRYVYEGALSNCDGPVILDSN